MKLLYSTTSPYSAKARMAARYLGLDVESVTTNTEEAPEILTGNNPLGKIPTLVLEDGTTLFDSRVIVDYLDHLSGGKLIPGGEARFAQLRLQALADGICDAALLKVYEGRFRPEEARNANWVAHQDGKVARGLASLEAAPPSFPERPRVGEIALACALGYLDLRFEGAWRAGHPALVTWLDGFAAKVPAFEATRFKG